MKTQLQEAGLDAENMVTTTSTLRDKLYGLTEGKVDIMVDDKTLKSTAQILRELSTAYNQLDDDFKKAAILELVAGKVQANVLASLLQNFDLAEKAMETSANSAGSALAENATFLDSIDGKTKRFVNATENLWNNLIDSNTVKWFVDQGTTVMNFLDGITSKLGIIGTASIRLTLSVLSKFFKGFNLGVNESVLGMGSLSNATMALSGGLLSMIGYLAKVRPSFGALKGEIEGTSAAAQGLLVLVKGIGSIPVGGWIALAVAAAAAITAAIIAFNNVSYKEHVDKLKESHKELTLIQQNIKDLNTEIETTGDRIEELQKLAKDGTISPVEKDELDELIRYNTELERQAYIQKAANKYQQKKTAQEFLDTYNSSNSLSNNGYNIYANAHGEILNGDDLNWFERGWNKGKITGEVYANGSWLDDKLKEYEQAQEDLRVAESHLADRRSIEGTSQAQLFDPLKDYEKRAEKAREKVDRIDDVLYEASQGWKDLLENQEYYYAEGDKELEEWQKKSNEAYKAVSAAQDKYLYTIAKTPAEKAMYRQQTLNRIFTTQASDAAKKVKKLVDEGASREMILGAMRDMDQTEFQYFGMTSPSEIIDYLIGMAEAGKRAAEEAQELAENLEHIASLPSSIDALTASFESYSKALDVVNAISSNNITLTEDQYKALNEYLGSEEEFAKAIDTYNGNLVKNKDALVKLLDTKKKETQENLKLSRAQAKVAYAKLNGELKKVITSTKDYNTSTKNSVKSLKDQIDSVKNVIKQYDRLEDQLLGTYSAFDKFEDAKTADAATDYTSKVVDMLEAVDDGFKTAKVGSETFMSAMEGLVPPTIGINFEDPTDKIQAMYDYIYSTVAKYATIDEDDGISITMPNVKSFVEDAIASGVFTGSWEDFDLVDGKTIDDLVNGLNISEPLAYALLEGLSDYVIGGESILAQFDTSLEGRYTRIVEELAKVNEKYIGSLESFSDSSINKAKIEEEYADIQSELNGIYNESISSAKDYLDTEIKLAEAQEQYNDLYLKYQQGLKEDGTEYSRTELALLQNQVNSTFDTVSELQSKLNGFESIDVISTIAVEGVNQKVEELNVLIDELELKKEQMEEDGISTADVDRQIKEAEDQIAELNNTKIELNANYIQSNESVLDSLEKIEEFKIGDKEFSLTIKNAATTFNQLKKFVEQQMKLDGATVHMSVQYDGSAVKTNQGKEESVLRPALIGGRNKGTEITLPDGTKVTLGGIAWAQGKNNALVGELGQELVVDPNNGKFFTVGDHGAEFADIPDNAIVFNHKQTKDLLTRGHTTRGRALAGGNVDYYPSTIFGPHSISTGTDSPIYKLIKDIADNIARNSDGYLKWAQAYNALINGTLDYRNRPVLDQQTYNKQVSNEYDKLYGDYATTYDVSYFASDFGSALPYTVAVTPILESGEVLSSESLGDYLYGLFDGANTIEQVLNKDTEHLIIAYKAATEEDFANFFNEWSKFEENLQKDTNQMIGDFSNWIWGDFEENLIKPKNEALDAYLNAYEETIRLLLLYVNSLDQAQNDSLDSIINRLQTKYNVQQTTGYATGLYGKHGPKLHALVGELGRELIVDPHRGRYYTVGNNGAEFANIPRDAIIFNNAQTEQLLGGENLQRGSAFASGNATFGKYYTPPKSDDDDDDDSSTNEFEQTIDFIEYKFEELSQTIEQLNAKLENTVDLAEKNKLIDDIIMNYRQQLQNIPVAITVYSQKAAEELAKIPYEYRDKAMNGAFEIKDFVGDGYEDIVKAIEDYRDFANKVDELNVQLEETRVNISESAIKKLENIQTKYETDDISIQASIDKLNSQISYLETTGEEVKTEYYEQIIPYQKQELELLKQERQELEKELTAAISRGDILEGSQAYLDQIQKIYDLESAANDKSNEIAETNLKIAQTNFDNTTHAYENQMRSAEVTLNRLQNQVNLVEEQGDYVSSHFYKNMIDLNNEELETLKQKKVALKQVLDQEIAAGRIVIGSDPYYEMVDAIYDVDEALDDAVLSIEQFQNSINDLHWGNFDKLLNRLGYVDSEISHIYDLMSDHKVVDDFGEWTEEGITALAMQAQAMEAAGYKSKQYAEQIQELKRTQDRYSDEEYTAKLNELIEGQWDSIELFESAKDAIIQLNKTRVDAVKDGIQKEIDAYQELIELKKQELSASKD